MKSLAQQAFETFLSNGGQIRRIPAGVATLSPAARAYLAAREDRRIPSPTTPDLEGVPLPKVEVARD